MNDYAVFEKAMLDSLALRVLGYGDDHVTWLNSMNISPRSHLDELTQKFALAAFADGVAHGLVASLAACPACEGTGDREIYYSENSTFTVGCNQCGWLRTLIKSIENYESSENICGAWGGCILPKGHNVGQVDIPSNHLYERTET